MTKTLPQASPTSAEGSVDDASVEALQSLGRYVVRRRIGRGGMGTVLAAYDPELDRRVAIKIVPGFRDQNVLAPAGKRLRREAQSLARLNHPNVVTVYDAGFHGHFVYIVMEHVDGSDLRAWASAKPRDWDASLDVLVAAAVGIAAAHASGIVHCDIKPENVLVGDDGRVRVCDFGLARLRHTIERSQGVGSSERFGTPAYMAPETLFEGTLSTAADQFAFCVMAIEVLTGARPVVGVSSDRPRPGARRYLRRQRAILALLERGLAEDPTDRHPSMDALLDALRRGKRRRRFARIGAGIAVGLAVGLGGSALGRDAEPTCADLGAQLAEEWGERRGAARDAVLDSGDPAAEVAWARVEQEIDAYAAEWATQREAACRSERAQVPDHRAPRRRACLFQRRGAVLAWADLLAGRDRRSVVLDDLDAFELPSLAACADEAEWVHLPPVPAQPTAAAIVAEQRRVVSEAAALWQAGRADDALARLAPAEAMATAVGYSPLAAEIALEQGRAHRARGDWDQAEPALRRAIVLAEQSDHAIAGVEAWIELAAYHARDRHELTSAWGWLGAADVALDSVGRPAELVARFQLLRGRWMLENDQFELACSTFQDLADARPMVVEEHIVAHELGSCLITLRRWDDAKRWLDRALAVREERGGPTHPLVAETLGAIGRMYARSLRPFQAEAPLRRALDVLALQATPRPGLRAEVLTTLGGVLMRRGELEASRETLEAAVAIVTDSRPRADQVGPLSNLGATYSRLGMHERAREVLLQSLDAAIEAFGPDNSRCSVPLINLAHATERAGEFAPAATWFERAAEAMASQPSRRGTRARLLLEAADMLWRRRVDRARALRLAHEAANVARGTGSMISVSRWLAERHLSLTGGTQTQDVDEASPESPPE